MTAKAIMVQGTMSGAGKSLLVAALCRIFAQDGYRVAPFKSQNMALNSFITADGCEMGRAQVVQAQAAGIPPESAMNPILLKPTTDMGSQVIVNGRVLGNMAAREYYAFKKQLVPDILAAYRSLAERFDIIVIEGAGSPAEVNLKEDDIVNMGMAKMAAAPVLLVGDIDRGGVFAQLVGTMILLDEDERALVKATVVNKFRGDASILEPGLDILRERTGVPVAGVVPYVDVDIDDEDSLSERFAADAAAAVDIAVVRLPRISNFTDFIALSAIEGVGVRYVSRPHELGEPDLVVLPGTKSTLADLKWLRESGLEAAILKRASAGTPIFGICGGFQMLGAEVADPAGVEGGGTMRGLGLLPMRTEFRAGKRQEHVVKGVGTVGGVLRGLSGVEVEGYEIHMGVSTILPVRGEGRGIPCSRTVVQPGRPEEGEGAPVLKQSSLWKIPTGDFRRCGTARGTPSPSSGLRFHDGIAQTDSVSWGAPAPPLELPGRSCGNGDSYCSESGGPTAPEGAGEWDGALCQVGNVYGTYVHGFFDREECAQAVVSGLLEAKGMDASALRAVDLREYREQQYDRLADAVRGALDMGLVYRILEEGV